MKVWITKYALTTGIMEVDAEPCGENMVKCRMNGSRFFQYYHTEGKDWHKSQESAIKRAEEMRIKKLQSYDKAIKKLSKINFEIPKTNCNIGD